MNNNLYLKALMMLPNIKQVTYVPGEDLWYHVQHTDGTESVYLVATDDDCYTMADFSNLITSDDGESDCSGGHTHDEIDDAVRAWGWDALLDVDEEVAKATVDGCEFYIYRTAVESDVGELQVAEINNSNSKRVINVSDSE